MVAVAAEVLIEMCTANVVWGVTVLNEGDPCMQNQKPEPSLLDRERERLKKLPKEQQEALAREVRARYPNVFALTDKLQAKPWGQALLKNAL